MFAIPFNMPRFAVTYLTLITSFLICSHAMAAPLPLLQTWTSNRTTGEKRLAASDLNKVLLLLQEDPAATELLASLKSALGATDPEDLLKNIRLCDLESGVAGSVRLPPKNSSIEPCLCMRNDMTALEAALALAHEGTHLLGYLESHESTSPSIWNYPDEKSWTLAKLREPGGEKDAYLAQTKLFKRLKRKYGLPFTDRFEKWINAKGELTQNDAFEKAILTDRTYIREFHQLYRDEIKATGLKIQNRLREISLLDEPSLKIRISIAKDSSQPDAARHIEQLEAQVIELQKEQKDLQTQLQSFQKRFGNVPR